MAATTGTGAFSIASCTACSEAPRGGLAEFGNVGAGDEGAAGADEHDGLGRLVAGQLVERPGQPVADIGG